MKNFKILIVLSLTALVFACSPQNEAVPTPSESQDLVLNQSTTKSSSNLFEDENALAWAAFITGKILFNTQNASERSYFNTSGVPSSRPVGQATALERVDVVLL